MKIRSKMRPSVKQLWGLRNKSRSGIPTTPKVVGYSWKFRAFSYGWGGGRWQSTIGMRTLRIGS